jgi:hypothetical protein
MSLVPPCLPGDTRSIAQRIAARNVHMAGLWTRLLADAGVPQVSPAVPDYVLDDERAHGMLASHPAVRAYVATYEPADDGMLAFASDYAAIAWDLQRVTHHRPETRDGAIWDLGCAWGVQRVLLPPRRYVGVDACAAVSPAPAICDASSDHARLVPIPFFGEDNPGMTYLVGRVPDVLTASAPQAGDVFISNMSLGYGPVSPAHVLADSLAVFGAGYFRGPLEIARALLDRFPSSALIHESSHGMAPLLWVGQAPHPFALARHD